MRHHCAMNDTEASRTLANKGMRAGADDISLDVDDFRPRSMLRQPQQLFATPPSRRSRQHARRHFRVLFRDDAHASLGAYSRARIDSKNTEPFARKW